MARSKYKDSAGFPVARCTSIIGDNLGWNKNILMAWARKVAMAGQDPNIVKNVAASIGTLTHDMIEAHIYGTQLSQKKLSSYDFDSLALACRGKDQYKLWEKSMGVEYLESEFSIQGIDTNLYYKFGGTADAIATINGKTTLIDFKTSKGVYNDHIIQVAAYKHGIELVSDYKIDEVVLVHINKDCTIGDDEIVTPHPVSSDNIELGWEIFKTLCFLNNAKKELVL